jgi:hypothetical protein
MRQRGTLINVSYTREERTTCAAVSLSVLTQADLEGADRKRSGLVAYLHRVDGARERVVPRVVIVRHRGVGVHADVRGLAGQRPDGSLSFLDAPFTQLAQMRSAGAARSRPLSGAFRKTFARSELLSV